MKTENKGLPMPVTEVTDETFQSEVLENNIPVLVEFWAPWCGPCRKLAPIVQEIADLNDSVKVVKLNTDENPLTPSACGITSIPALLVFKDGASFKRLIGVQPKSKIDAMLQAAIE